MTYKCKRVKVEVDGKIYNSIASAAEAIGCQSYNISDTFRLGRTEYKGHTIRRFDGKYDDLIEAKKRGQSVNSFYNQNYKDKSRGVINTTTGEVFRSIAKAAESCNVQTWIMGLQLAKAGKFVDSKGNVFMKKSRYFELKREKEKELTEYKASVINSTHKSLSTSSSLTSTLSSIKTGTTLSESDEKALTTVTAGLVESGKYNEAVVLLNILRNKA